MRTLYLILFLLFAGCAQFKSATTDITECLKDPICRAEAVKEASDAKEIAVAVSGASPIPLSSNLVGGAIYGIVLILALAKKGKKREELPPAQ